MADFTDFAPSLLGRILWKGRFFFMLGRILWEPNFVGAEICGRQNSDFLEGLQFLYQIWAILLGEEIHMKV